MAQVKLTINGREIKAPEGATILEAARAEGMYIPVLCHHPDLPPAEGTRPAHAVYQGGRRIENTMPGELGKGCGLCVVEVEGEDKLVASCRTEAAEGMVVVTENDRIRARRQENLVAILARHPHACLTCVQQEGCSREECSSNVPENERCCRLFGHCELKDVIQFIGILPSTPRWAPTDLPVITDHPLLVRDYNLCIGCTRCVRACSDLRGVEAVGFVYDAHGLIQVGSVTPSLEESDCRFCAACVEVCPTGALMEKSVHPGKRDENIVPCKTACPVHMEIPGYLRLIAAGKRDEANAVIREKAPFPGVLGRVCSHPCEQVCRRGEVNAPVSICALKRYAAEGDKGFWKQKGIADWGTGRKVAVVGAGPAGLTAAFYLRKKGHIVTVFEARKEAGGMMRYGIPSYRLPREVLKKEIKDILETGIELRTRESLGKDFTLDGLKRVGFDAIFLAIGAGLGQRLVIEGSHMPDVLWGVEFLAQVAQGRKVCLKHHVVVIGGGNVAVDAARTALRCGAEDVTMVCLERREEVPAHIQEFEGALAEGVKFLPSWGPRKILSRDGRLAGVELVQCTRVFDKRRDFSPTFGNVRKVIEADQVIMAVGQTADLSFAESDRRLHVHRGFLAVDQETLNTGMEGVYAGGDVTSMPGTVVHAIAAGRRAASAIDRFLGGTGDIEEVLFERDAPSQFLGRDKGFALREREKAPEIGLQSRREGFREVYFGLSDDQAVREARRCLQCDLRLYLRDNPAPPEGLAVFHPENLALVPKTEGVYRLYDAEMNVLAIKGTSDLRKGLQKDLEDGSAASWFYIEKNKMYSRRESELIQQYLQTYGRMPGERDSDLDALF
jgi:formate dehydrogenase (NADP+) beta subunit